MDCRRPGRVPKREADRIAGGKKIPSWIRCGAHCAPVSCSRQRPVAPATAVRSVSSTHFFTSSARVYHLRRRHVPAHGNGASMGFAGIVPCDVGRLPARFDNLKDLLMVAALGVWMRGFPRVPGPAGFPIEFHAVRFTKTWKGTIHTPARQKTGCRKSDAAEGKVGTPGHHQPRRRLQLL